MEKDTAFVPFTEGEYAAKRGVSIERVRELTEDAPLVNLVYLVGHQLFGWPMCLFFAVSTGNNSTPGDRKNGHFTASHFDPYSALFTSAQRISVAWSDLGVGLVGWALLRMSSEIGLGNTILLYFIPYLWVNSWIVAITYLHHTHPSIPHYAGQNWTFLKGALGTVDRSFGFIGRHFFHEIIDYHVIHHMFPKIPFYKAEEATIAIRPLLGPSYQENKKESFVLSLFKTFQKCKYVSDGAVSPDEKGSGVFYWHKHKM
ncbi:fatty acid desaturase [Penicillium nucicola]|uniref:fatty acid desaturase n=1 Tax=Penicillium nucicola TaxID=1850975 RepID=UPI0025450AC3|nr:fatty acid desaturase [Penicillium nucicola]KAJ5775721.1 fatty acid desaturase [Penicillium nucicola]